METFAKAAVSNQRFVDRHIGPQSQEISDMLLEIGYSSLDTVIDAAIPKSIRTPTPLHLSPPLTEEQALAKIREIALKNKVFRSFIGMGYYDCHVPAVIQRNILENPGWYTQYTPYQAEIAQGRLEALLNFQTMVSDLTGLPVANASLLDEATAAAEAMCLAYNCRQNENNILFLVAQDCHPQTISVIQTRAEPLGIEVVVSDPSKVDLTNPPFGMVLQYPGTDGRVVDYSNLISKAKSAGVIITVACDLLALTLLKSPGELGADIAFGNAQRFGVPLGFGGPHAAFFAVIDDFKRKLPGRIIGVSKDSDGRQALRMALQTREQHIRREKATSNICTSQVLLAIMNSMYGIYHGPQGLKTIAKRVHSLTYLLAQELQRLGYEKAHDSYFDTLKIKFKPDLVNKLRSLANENSFNLRFYHDNYVGIALDETTTPLDVSQIAYVFSSLDAKNSSTKQSDETQILAKYGQTNFSMQVPENLIRTSSYLEHPVFNSHHSETKMLRYIKTLESRDLSLTQAMIPLGSCTMKLNATAELLPISWPEFNRIHPFAPAEQTSGYLELFNLLESYLAECTGFNSISLQPNSGAQGEFAGLMVIRKYNQFRGQSHRNICLIPKSAHGTNPASAAMAGMKIVVVECDEFGNIDVSDLKQKAQTYRDNLAALMITYPSTHGVFEDSVTQICQVIHEFGGQVYMDGANMNAQIGLCRPGEFGPDVCHLNLHKTFCIPHGGGGPGMGPIGVKKHLAPFLPGHSVSKNIASPSGQECGAIAAAAWGSASILPISLMYIWMMGSEGLTKATKVAILNANYLAKKLQPYFPVLYRGASGLVAHECIIDLRPLKSKTGIEVEDVAKRLMDYGFHAPTVSFPVAGTLMIEPTESESLEELDLFCEAMISIRGEIKAIEEGRAQKDNNILTNAPHTAEQVTHTEWNRPYSRIEAAYPKPWVKNRKFWPYVSRVNSAYGDRNLVCSCPPITDYES